MSDIDVIRIRDLLLSLLSLKIIGNNEYLEVCIGVMEGRKSVDMREYEHILRALRSSSV